MIAGGKAVEWRRTGNCGAGLVIDGGGDGCGDSSEMEGGAKRARACYVANSITSERPDGDLRTLLAAKGRRLFRKAFPDT